MKTHNHHAVAAAGVLALVAVAAFASGDAIRLGGMKQSPATIYRLPALPDSAERPANPFKSESLLPASLRSGLPEALRAEMQDWTTLEPDTAGVYKLNLRKSADEAGIVRLATNIRPESYLSGKIVVSTPLAGAIYLNGSRLAVKSAQDSVARDFEAKISLIPQQDACIEVALLADPSTKGSAEAAVRLVPDTDSDKVAVTVNPAKGRFNIMTTVIGPRVSDVTISPDGRYMIVTTTETTDGKNTATSCDIRECASGKVTTLNAATGMAWLPGKPSTLYYTVDKAGDTFDIISEDYPSRAVKVLAQGLPKEAKHFSISPKGDYIVFATRAEAPAATGTMRRIENPDDRLPGNRDRSYLSMVSLSDGIVRPLTYGGASTSAADISRDGSKLLYISARETPSRFPFYEFDLVSLDVRTLKTDTLLRREPSMTTACFSPDGGKVFVTAGPSFFNKIGSNCGNHPIANDFDTQGYILDIKSGDVRSVTRDFDPSIFGTPVWNAGDGHIYFRALKGFDCKVYSLNPSDGKIDELPTEIDYIRAFSIGEDESRYLAYAGMSYDYMGRACLLDLKSRRNRLIADPTAALIADTDLGESQMWSFTSADGTIVEGTVTLPPDFDPAKKYPLIVYYYGGTTPSNHTNHSPYSTHLFASKGYVVYVLNPSGTIGYGQEYSARHVNAWGERTADEIILGTEKLCEQMPFIDKSRIGCIGASYGGFMTQLLTTKTDLFAAAVSHAGISNVASYWGEGFWGYSYNAVAAAESYPWSNPEVFTRNSALFNADKIHTPLLLLHGSVDTNVPIGESIQLFNALKILGRDVEFVTVDGENHIIMDFEKRKEWHNTIMAWFEKWLKGDSRWWDSIYKKN